MKRSTVFLFFTGFLITFGAVGAIETDAPLLDSCLIGVLGLAIMGCGAIKLNRDALIDNPTL